MEQFILTSIFLIGIIACVLAGYWCSYLVLELVTGRWIKSRIAYRTHDALVAALFAYYYASKTGGDTLIADQMACNALFNSRPYLMMTWEQRLKQLSDDSEARR